MLVIKNMIAKIGISGFFALMIISIVIFFVAFVLTRDDEIPRVESVPDGLEYALQSARSADFIRFSVNGKTYKSYCYRLEDKPSQLCTSNRNSYKNKYIGSNVLFLRFSGSRKFVEGMILSGDFLFENKISQIKTTKEQITAYKNNRMGLKIFGKILGFFSVLQIFFSVVCLIFLNKNK
ncbi:hypothetical protein [Stenoxybacter acetivorans]|uniref:hypothetical protein n=1 Tax=Stenoxybacter acetivorans TaxID=422441 RepID=UPI000561E653|nr:hypothetical protein [Stenoxybacter acetivorans]